jgi:N-acetylglucosamine kinase-like BadF-type ATPase
VQFPTLIRVPPLLLDGAKATGAKYVAGVDGGATKTVVAVLDLETSRVSLGHGGPSNVDADGAEVVTASVGTAMRAALGAAGIEGKDLGAVVFALAGSSLEADVAREIECAFSLRHTYFINDVVAAWACGTWVEPGVAVISGTGSNVFGVNAAGASWRSGGWGHILGDQGSGYSLGIEAMKAALAYRDASGPPTALLDAVLEFYDLRVVEDLQDLVYGKPLTKGEIAAFALEVASVARSGDTVACDLFDAAARDLATQVRAPVEVLGLADGPFVVALVGSVFGGRSLLRAPFETAVRQFAPHAVFVVPDLAPVGGSLLLAVRAERAWDQVDRSSMRDQLAARGAVGHSG